MNIKEFDRLIGQGSYVRCSDKIRKDTAIVGLDKAQTHVFHGGQLGWWVRPGYIVVDIDEGVPEAMKIIKHFQLKTLTVRTPKGIHLYFKTDRDFPQKVKMVTPFGLTCDFRCANKGYVLLPFGSENRRFNKCREVAELPLEFTPLTNRRDSLLNLKEGDGRNSTLFAHLMAYKNKGASEDQVEEMAQLINKYVFQDPMTDKEMGKLLNSIDKYEAQNEGENPYILYTDKGRPYAVNNRAIVDYFVNRGDTFVLGDDCYQYSMGVYQRANSQVRSTIKDMIMVDTLISQERIMSAFRLLLDDPRVQRSASQLNADSRLINFTNGIYNTETKKMMPHDSQHLQTLQIPHEVRAYKPFNETRLYEYLKLCRLSEDDINMTIRYMAYCLSLDHGLKTFMMLYGPSNTGKSVLLRFIETLVGTHNTSALSMHELSARFYPAQLYNKLLNSCGDNGALPLSSIESLKKITGGDQIMHEEKGKQPFFFVPFCKLIFSFNQLPLQLEEKSDAFYKRMRILHMKTPLELDDAYVSKLCSNESIEEVIPYLLTLLPMKEIPRTRVSDKLVKTLRSDSDTIQAFINDMCIEGYEFTVSKDSLFEQYNEYCIESGREAHRKHGFMRAMRALGYKEARGSDREYKWRGLTTKKEREKLSVRKRISGENT